MDRAEIGIILLQQDFANLERGTSCGGLRHILLKADGEDVPSRRCRQQQNHAPGRFSDFQMHCTGTRGLRMAAGVSGRASETLSMKSNVSLEQFVQEAFVWNLARLLVWHQ